MRSCSTALAVFLALVCSLAGCAADSDKRVYAPAATYPSKAPERPLPSPMDPGREPESEVITVPRSEELFGGSAQTDAPSPPPPPRPEADRSGSTIPGPAQLPQGIQPTTGKKPERPDPTKEPAQNRDLVIYTAHFTMAVYQVDQGLAAVEKIARDNGGYLGQKKDREITVRIPRGRFETTLAAVNTIGDVLHREIQAVDVTDEHVDLEIRIKNARAMQKRLSELLSKASVKDALEIEKELHRVTEQLERLEGRMKVLKDKVAFSTITVTFEPRGTTIQTARVRLPFPWLGALNLPSLLSLSEEK